LAICSSFQLQKARYCQKGKKTANARHQVALSETLGATGAASVRSNFYVFAQRGSPQRSADTQISYFSPGGAPTFVDCIMQFKRRMQQSGVSTMNTWPIFSKLFHLQLAAIHTQARGQEKRCCSFMLLQPAFLLPVNLKISQNWLVLEWRGTDGSVLPLFLCL